MTSSSSYSFCIESKYDVRLKICKENVFHLLGTGGIETLVSKFVTVQVAQYLIISYLNWFLCAHQYSFVSGVPCLY